MAEEGKDYPSFDSLRYLDNWLGLIERYGKETTLRWLVIWQALNHYKTEFWPMVFPDVFGGLVETVIPELMNNPPVLTGRFTTIQGDDFPERLKAYCEIIMAKYKWWSLYDP